MKKAEGTWGSLAEARQVPITAIPFSFSPEAKAFEPETEATSSAAVAAPSVEGDVEAAGLRPGEAQGEAADDVGAATSAEMGVSTPRAGFSYPSDVGSPGRQLLSPSYRHTHKAQRSLRAALSAVKMPGVKEMDVCSPLVGSNAEEGEWDMMDEYEDEDDGGGDDAAAEFKCASCALFHTQPPPGHPSRCWCLWSGFNFWLQADDEAVLAAKRRLSRGVKFWGAPPMRWGDCTGRQLRVVIYYKIYNEIHHVQGAHLEQDELEAIGRGRISLPSCIRAVVRSRFPDNADDDKKRDILKELARKGDKEAADLLATMEANDAARAGEDSDGESE